VGYELLPAFQHKGIMTEALEKVIAFGFDEMKLQRIEAWTTKENHASIKLLQKNNFIKDLAKENNDGPDMVIYSLEKIIE
jgi:ribosomal-protein-alanine N-acetyltransferase